MLIENSGFESGLANWQVFNGTANITSDALAGANAISLTSSRAGIDQGFSVLPGETYTFSGYGKTTESAWNGFGVTFYDDQGTVLDKTSTRITGDTWTEYSFDVLALEGSSRGILWAWKGGDTGTTELDELNVSGNTPTPLPSTDGELLSNSDFETNLTDWNTFRGSETTTTDSFEGSFALQLSENGSGISQAVSIVGGESYQLSGYGKYDGDFRSSLGIDFWDASWNLIEGYSTSINSVDWQLYQITQEAPANAAHATVWSWKGGNSGSTVLDALSVQSIAEPPVNQAPTITSNGAQDSVSLPFSENGTEIIANIDATDPDGDTEGNGLIYTLDGPDVSQISIDPNTGEISFNAAPDFENPTDTNGDNQYSVDVVVTDVQGAQDIQSLAINITDVQEPTNEPTVVRYEAEDAQIIGARVASNHAGASGEFVDYINPTGDFIEWTVNADQVGMYELSWRYALARPTSRPLELKINGETVNPDLGFTTTGTVWSDWSFVSQSALLDAGQNTIRLTAIGSSGANIDYLDVLANAAKINFQAGGVATPEGYVADTGLAYSVARGFGWVTEASAGSANATPLDISQYGRDRNITGYDQRLDTLLHLDHPAATTRAAWEYALPNGRYSVTVSVGDNAFNNDGHRINVEGTALIPLFNPNQIQDFALGTATVTVNDGKLTLDSIGGDNTKINYLEFQPLGNDTSRIPGGSPSSRAMGVSTTSAITLDVDTPGVSNGVDGSTLNSSSVQLYRTIDGALVDGIVNTTGGNDAIVFQPSSPLDAQTHYTFRINSDVKDLAGNDFEPFSTTFSTGIGETGTPIDFARSTVASGLPVTTLEMSPDASHLYAATLTGDIHRWDINADGSLANQQTFSSPDLAGRAIIGFVFDPADPNTIWISHNDTIFERPAADFTGKVSKLALSSNSQFTPTLDDYVVGLPRSIRDHLSNSLEFGPDGALYMVQGSNTAMGAPDNAWGLRPERLLTASVLRIDTTLTPPIGGFNVQTEDYNGTVGTYDPNASGAPVTIFGEGVRNPYDLVWHSNGSLYVPTNGSAAGGNTPDDPNQSGDQSLNGVSTQNDYLYKVEEGGYYGHPNPEQGNYILNGGNPTAGVDLAEVTEYAVGTLPDPNFQGFAYDFGRNRSPNGVIEYQSNSFGGALQNRLLVVEFSGGDDILALQPGADGDIVRSFQVASGFNNPLDLVENPVTGDIYVAEFASNGNFADDVITLLKTVNSAENPDPPETARLEIDNPIPFLADDRLSFSSVQTVVDGIQSADIANTATLNVSNTGTSALEISSISTTGQFELVDSQLANGFSVAPGATTELDVRFAPATGSPRIENGTLVITANDASVPVTTVTLAGYTQSQLESGQEPSVDEIVEVFGFQTNLGNLTNSSGDSGPTGDEVISPYWVVADPNEAVSVLQIAAYTGPRDYQLGYFEQVAGATTNDQLALNGVVTRSPTDGQTLLPSGLVNGTDSELIAQNTFTPDGPLNGLRPEIPTLVTPYSNRRTKGRLAIAFCQGEIFFYGPFR